MTEAEVMGGISKLYGELTGRVCEVSSFVVCKQCPVGAYFVHPLDTSELYLVHVRRLERDAQPHQLIHGERAS